MYSRIVVSFPSASDDRWAAACGRHFERLFTTTMLYYDVVKFKILVTTTIHFSVVSAATWSVSLDKILKC